MKNQDIWATSLYFVNVIFYITSDLYQLKRAGSIYNLWIFELVSKKILFSLKVTQFVLRWYYFCTQGPGNILEESHKWEKIVEPEDQDISCKTESPRQYQWRY